MGTKRSSSDNIHESRQINFEQNSRPQKRSHPSPSNSKGQKPTSVNTLKEKIRDLTRLLERTDILPADVRLEKERALAGYKSDLERAVEERRKQDTIKKYHMVRFFERQKATRALKRIRTQFSTSAPADPENNESNSAIHEAEVDLAYTMYYPLAEKYQSLYPRTSAQGSENEKEIGGRGERKLGGQRPPLWGLVERSMADGTLEMLRDGKLGGCIVVGRSKPAPKETSGPPARFKKRKGPGGGGVKLIGGAASDSETSDEGFFEE